MRSRVFFSEMQHTTAVGRYFIILASVQVCLATPCTLAWDWISMKHQQHNFARARL